VLPHIFTTGPTWGLYPPLPVSIPGHNPSPFSTPSVQTILIQTFTCINTLAMSPLVTLDIWLICSPHIDQVSKKIAQRMRTLGPLLNGRSDLSVRNRVLLYKQFIHLHPARRYAAYTHGRRLEVLQSKCLRPATGAS
jgi:hypothetical protein